MNSPDLVAARDRLTAVYDGSLTRQAGHRMVDLVSSQLESAMRCEGDVLPWRDPPANVAAAAAALEQHLPTPDDRELVVERFGDLVEMMLQRGHNLHDPRYIGHQVPASVPISGWFDAVGSVTNQPMAIYDMGPWATAAEWAMVDRLGRSIGWTPGTFAGTVTHGGSLANLTALLAARNTCLSEGWERGFASNGVAPVIVAHSDAHYSISRAAGVLGLGTEQVVRVRLDARRRMDVDHLEEQLGELRDRHVPVVAVVACSCSTPIGAFDPLHEIAKVCRRFGVWLHVDAAHGGSACLSRRHRGLVDGLEQADSLIWDAHKMLFVPALCAFVMYRNRASQFEAFRQEAPYLFDPTAPGLAEYDSGLRTMECTKRAATFGLWGLWALFGRQLFSDLVDVTYALGQDLFQKLTEAEDFEPLHEPECNIVVFQHVPPALQVADADTVGRFQMDLRRRLIESGEYYIVSTKLDGVGALRTTIINPMTTSDHLDRLLDSLRGHGELLLR